MLNKQLFCALLLLVSLLTACGGTTGGGDKEVKMQSNRPPTNTTSIRTAEVENSRPAGNAVRVARWSRDPNGPAPLAPLKGRLAIVNNCLVIQDLPDDPPTLLIFPYDSGVWDDAKRTFNFKGKVLGIGESIEVTGGSIQSLDRLKAFGKYDAPDCGAKYFFQVFF